MTDNRSSRSNAPTRRKLARGIGLTVAVSLGAVACGTGTGTPGSGADAAAIGEMAAAEVERTVDGLPSPEQVDDTGAGSGSSSSSGGTGVVSQWGEVTPAVVRIETRGEFVSYDPGADALVLRRDSVGFGSGFFIDSDGIVVTNNHVVNGAAAITVYVPGESQPRNARVLGLSECWDLAVIDVDGGDFPYFDWSPLSPTAPQDIYAVGYPGGEPDVAVTEGVISRSNTDGEYPFASVDQAIEHTAQTAGGSSGGPLVTPDGLVIGVHNAASSQSQFAISAHDAEGVIEELRLGNDVDVIGITAEALPAALGGGVLVQAVETGSPADFAGIVPGDIVLELEEVSVALDGTLSDYCDVLRSHAPDAPLRVTYLSGDTVVQTTLVRDLVS